MAILSYYVIILVIIFSNILLNLLITFIYYLFLPDFIFNILNLIYLLLGINLLILHYKNISACYYIIKKCISLSFYCNFNFYLSIFYLLKLNLFLFEPIKI